MIIKPLGYEPWDIIKDGPYSFKNCLWVSIPKIKQKWDELDRKKMKLNAKAIAILFWALDKIKWV